MHISLSLHNHTLMSDGALSISDFLKFTSTEYNVVAITDHNCLTIPHPLHLKAANIRKKRFMLLRGIELSYPSVHLVGLEPLLQNPDSELVDVWRSCPISWLAHPKLDNIDAYQINKLSKDEPTLSGVEVFNSGIPQVSDTDLLPSHFNYFAVDDFHFMPQIKQSWMEMDTDSFDKFTIMEKIQRGEYTICSVSKPKNIYSL